MGSAGSRLGGPASRPPPYRHRHRRRPPAFKRALSSIFICGASPSSRPNLEMEDDPAEKPVSSSQHDKEKLHFPAKSSTLPHGTVSEFSNRTIVTGNGTRSSTTSHGSSNAGGGPSKARVDGRGKSLSENKELITDPYSIANSRVNEASTSYEDQHSPRSESAERGIHTMDGNVQSTFSSSRGLAESLADGVLVENSMGEIMVFHDCETSSTSALSSPSTDDTLQQDSPSSLSFFVTDRDQSQRDGNVLQVDVVGVSSNLPSTSASELSSREARPDSRSLFWDAFSRRSSGRNAESRFVLTSDDSNRLDPQDRWLLDFNADLLDNVTEGGSQSSGSNTNHSDEGRWHSTSEIWERFRDVGRNGTDRRTAATCPSGIHPDGACSCGSMVRAEESGARASISRIVMLAEALFEVLDEIHRQPTSQSFSTVSPPAPEAVVESLSVKDYKKSETDIGDGAPQCYICLADYEEGDKIRILPCRHEFHVTCVDKWLKEIHGVCPLCRGDVREGSSSREGAISGSALR